MMPKFRKKAKKKSAFALRREHIAKVRGVITREIERLELVYGQDAVGSAYSRHVEIRRKRGQLDAKRRQVNAEIRKLKGQQL
jgi:hypothetical protein